MKNKKLLSLFILLLSSCPARKYAAEIPQKQEVSGQGKFFIDDSKLKKLAHFTYGAKLEIDVGQGENHQQTAESIEIVADAQKISLKKATDSAHFIELFKDGESFLVKNQHHPWQRAENPLYPKLLSDALNITQWLAEQLALPTDSSLKKLVIKNAVVDKDAPLLKSLALKPHFLTSSAKVTAEISFDQNVAVPTDADFLVEIWGEDGHFIRIKSTMDLKQVKKALVVPEVVKEEVSAVPVNLSSRFTQLMELEQSK